MHATSRQVRNAHCCAAICRRRMKLKTGNPSFGGAKKGGMNSKMKVQDSATRTRRQLERDLARHHKERVGVAHVRRRGQKETQARHWINQGAIGKKWTVVGRSVAVAKIDAGSDSQGDRQSSVLARLCFPPSHALSFLARTPVQCQVANRLEMPDMRRTPCPAADCARWPTTHRSASSTCLRSRRCEQQTGNRKNDRFLTCTEES